MVSPGASFWLTETTAVLSPGTWSAAASWAAHWSLQHLVHNTVPFISELSHLQKICCRRYVPQCSPLLLF